MDCPLWEDPQIAMSPASLTVAMAAAGVVESKRWTGVPKSVDPIDLILGTKTQPGLIDDGVQKVLNVRRAAEAVIQHMPLPGRKTQETKAYNVYINSVASRVPTPDDEARLEQNLLLAGAKIAAIEYRAKLEDVVAEVKYMQGMALKPTREWRERQGGSWGVSWTERKKV